MTFKTQEEIWTHLVNGGKVILSNTTEIKFKDGALKASENGSEWSFCPIAFENPKLFWGMK